MEGFDTFAEARPLGLERFRLILPAQVFGAPTGTRGPPKLCLQVYRSFEVLRNYKELIRAAAARLRITWTAPVEAGWSKGPALAVDALIKTRTIEYNIFSAR